MLCKSCGKSDHQRKSSNLCKFYNPRPNNVKPNDNDKFYKRFYSYKQGFDTFIKDKNSKLHDNVKNIVAQVTETCFYATKLLNFHLQRCVEEEIPIPNIYDNKWIRQLFTRNISDNDLRISASHFPYLPHNNINGQVVSYLVKELIVNITNHLNDVYDNMTSRYVRFILESRGYTEDSIKECINDIFNNSENASPEFLELYTYYKLTYKLKILRMYFMNKIFVSTGKKLFTLCPNYTMRAKYITIDTDVLYNLIDIDMDKSSFGLLQYEMWQENFKIKSKYLGEKLKFNCMIKTDGVGCTVILYKWMDTNHKKKDNTIVNLPENPQWVGIDPGRKDIFTSCDESGRINKLSNRQYYDKSKFWERTRKMNKLIEDNKIDELMKNMPTSKTDCSDNTLLLMNYIFSYKKKIDLYFKIQCTRYIKHNRWRCYIHKHKTLDDACKRILRNKENPVISYGDASFCHNNKGHPSSLRGNWIYHRLKYIHNVTIFYTREYNTSQVCSNCHAERRLVGLCTKYDIFRSGTKRPNNTHFVRSCTNCRMIWNRDVNASRNILNLGKIGSKRPEVFSRKLPASIALR